MRRNTIIIIISVFVLMICSVCAVLIGKVDIGIKDLLTHFEYGSSQNSINDVIITTRINTIITAVLTGAGLAISGLLLQTLFNNPLADPSVLGISSGANLGVALCLMTMSATPSLIFSTGILSRQLWIVTSSLLGAMPVIVLLLYISRHISNKLVVLIVGLMISFINSAIVSVIEFFSMKESLYSYVLWGMGSFSNVPSSLLAYYSIIVILLLFCCCFLIKPLNAILLGDNYAKNIGIDICKSRYWIIFLSGLLIAVITANCGPIGFIGLAVPHIVRFSLRQSDHKVVIPLSIVWGGLLALLCLVISRLPGLDGALPINVITSIIGAPILIWILFQPSVKNIR